MYIFLILKSLILTCVPKHDPHSHLPPHNISLGHPHAPAPSMLHPTSDMEWRFNSYMIVYMLEEGEGGMIWVNISFKKNFMYLFWTALGPYCRKQAFSGCRNWGLLQLRHLASCCDGSSWGAHGGAQAQWLWCTGLVAPWPVGSSWIRDQTLSLALAGRFFTTEPPGKPYLFYRPDL